ncbi:uncharacterized protein LOC100197588 isoform X2 [Hydra vulgaris]|nr:uncharacterized protein LOC100197588 isoform X2 [Hydra vulgaris]XP_047130309.1 uncharacterized protein LOC100197588 isoform X2 [Hydra vulgaris]
MQLEDIFENLQLNFTLKKKYQPYRRYPEEEFDSVANRMETYELFSPFLIDASSNSSFIRYKNYDPVNYFRGTLLANITVTAQAAFQFRIVAGHTFVGNQGAGLQIMNPLQVEIIDINGNRVTSGPDSNLTVTTLSDVPNTCISSDSTFLLKRGIGTFSGSICGSILSTSLKFQVSSSIGTLTTNSTAPFLVLDTWNWYAATGTSQEDSVLLSLNYYLSNTYWLGSRTPNVFEHYTVKALINALKASKLNTADRLVAMIGPSDDALTDAYAAIAGANDYIMVSYTNTKSIYSDSTRYPHFMRVTFTDSYRFLLIANALANRNWKKIAVATVINIPLPEEFLVHTTFFKILYDVVYFPIYINKESMDIFFNDLIATKTRIFFSFLSGDYLKAMVAQVALRNLTAENGYLWLGEDNMINDFPYDNGGLCANITPTCVEAFRGATVFETHYPVSGFEGGNFDRLKLAHGQQYHQVMTWTGDYYEKVVATLAWDALSITASALIFMSNNKLTVTSKFLRELILTKTSPFTLTGTILFDNSGNRRNYTASLLQFDGLPGENNRSVLKRKRYLYLGDNVTLQNILINNALCEISVAGQKMIYHNVLQINKNRISYNSIKGTMNDDLSINGPIAFVKTVITEYIPPAYYCSHGCGGKPLDLSDLTIWEHGTCIKQDVCQCNLNPNTGNLGYSGPTCNITICEFCSYGTCVSPGKCVCYEGYVSSADNNDCSVPTCYKFGCSVNGYCASADICQCDPGFYGLDCSKKCQCVHGLCNDGNSGTGKCSCESGYIGATCSTKTLAIAIPVVLGCIVLFALLFFIGRQKYKEMQLQAQLMSTDWKAEWETIRLRQKGQKSSMKSLAIDVSKISGNSGISKEIVYNENQAVWNSKDVMLKRLRKDDIELNDTIRWEIKQMKDLKHPNLCLFIGACLQSPNVSILNEVCAKGSLEDILYNDDIALGWNFKYSMLKDICRGMMYLASSEIKSHGRLKSSNCLVDNRWTVKLADYGLKTFRSNEQGVRLFSPGDGLGVNIPTQEELEGCDYYNLLWTAPEIINTGVSHPNHVGYGNIKADVYSYSIIMVEMCTRQQPFHELDQIKIEKIIQMVGRLIPIPNNVATVDCRDNEGIPIKALRPQVDTSDLPEGEIQANAYKNLLKDCWNQDFNCRPTFAKIIQQLNTISPHRGELMDNLIALMEQYTNSLEAIVAERTMDLKEQKDKCDLLLTKMLPPLIAEELKSGNNPKPEFFSCVTVYFSDVVGFGKMCSTCTPYEIVDLLNDLYSVMDDIIESFDCYKVETIGDCYMVVSGLPVRNGDQHACEVANMSLQLLSSLNGIGYRHLAGSQVQLRIGMHSGPVVAGVVGIKMPRYCLFGDTVNTASRMESGGFALKIHLSEDTYKILQTFEGYQFFCRGERQVKGRGLMTTYYLIGKEGASYNLPTEDMALSASQHYFK